MVTNMGRKHAIGKIIGFGERFEREYLSKAYLEHKNINIERLRDDWWEALKLFLTRAFYQGRRDEVSERVEKEILGVLRRYFDDLSERGNNFKTLKASNWNFLKRILKGKIGRGKIGRGRDIDMTIDALEFISRLPEKNIVCYSIEMIEKGKLKELWCNLQKSKSRHGIRSVGPKTASLYLRDLVIVLGLQQKISYNDLVFLQPVDTWVMQIAKKIGIKEKEDENVRREIIKICQERESAIRFNEGAWYIGTHSLEILLEMLLKS